MLEAPLAQDGVGSFDASLILPPHPWWWQVTASPRCVWAHLEVLLSRVPVTTQPAQNSRSQTPRLSALPFQHRSARAFPSPNTALLLGSEIKTPTHPCF